MSVIDVRPAARAAVSGGRAVVALESTVYSTLGLPAPSNRTALERSCAAIASLDAVPAVTAILAGRPTVGVTEYELILQATRKVAARDIAVAAAQQWPVGVTTVGASLVLAAHAGISVFATGGIGGVHRDAGSTGDVSGDLDELAAHPIATVCAGAKSFLDLRVTLEALETRGVTVIGYGTDELPAFTAASSGLALPHRCDDPAEVAGILHHRQRLRQGGVLVCVPPPEPIDPDVLAAATVEAEARASEAGIDGPARTPFVLGAIAELTDGRSVSSNIALVENNARVAALIASALAGRSR